MKKAIKWLGILLILIFITAQFFQPEKNIQPVDENHLFNAANIPESVKESIQNACLDCHSNQTTYLWYHHISPVSLMVNNHIVEGKKNLNFSEWKQLGVIDKISLLNKICEETENEGMPLTSYTLMHKKANLSETQIKEICAWAESYGLELFKSR